jgi:biotin operon repressor
MANENKKEALELEKESVKTLEEKISKLEKLEEQYSRINNIQGTFEQSATKEKEALEAKLNLLRIEKEIKDALLKTIDQTGKSQEQIAKELEKQFKAIDEQNLSYAKGLGLSEEMVQNLKKAREESEKLTKESKEYEKSLSGARNMASELGKASVFFSTNIVGMAKKMQSQLKAGDQATRARIDAMKDQFLSFSNFLASTSLVIIETTKKLVMAADAATTTLAAATGMGRQLNDVLVSAQRSGNLFALTMEESGKAITALVGGTTNFVNVSKASQAAIATNVGLLSKLGVSAETSAEMIQNLNLNLGMTLEQASETAVSLAMMGTELGISASQITKDFNQSLGTLAVYGPRATTVFKNLAASAKSAGVETSKLLGIAKKFDTFGEAANTVGRLNALLGTQLSTTEMLMKTEDERIETLIESVQAQGVAFKDLDRFQQKASAAAAGIDDLAEAQRIFGMDIGMYREYQCRYPSCNAVNGYL